MLTLQQSNSLTAPTLLDERTIRLKPVVREISADLETPTSLYVKLRQTAPSFLLESVTGGEQLGRYSFIGVQPRAIFRLQGQTWILTDYLTDTQQELAFEGDPLITLREAMKQYDVLDLPANISGGMPYFSGGLVGFLGYEMTAAFEPATGLCLNDRSEGLPDAVFLLMDSLAIVDHAFSRVLLIAHADLSGDEGEHDAFLRAEQKLDQMERSINRPLTGQVDKNPAPNQQVACGPMLANQTKEEFFERVNIAKEHIAAGDIFQVVLSQRFARPTPARPFNIYRTLRRLNPSPYLFFMDLRHSGLAEELVLIGSSPELQVGLRDGIASVRPIAGTLPRGKTPEQDMQHAVQLREDPKEVAEHVMLVDLARNDLGSVCAYGSVKVTELLEVERYSHVMHLVSHVEGKLNNAYDAFDLIRCTFPAGTVSGAPKIRAMQIIDSLERERRGPYAGLVGYIGFQGNVDTCITLRTIVMRDGVAFLQAGAGIVADSVPEREYQETLHKARALEEAIRRAETEFEN